MAERTALLAHPGAELYGSDRMLLETIVSLVERDWRVVLAVPNDGPLVPEAERAGAEVVFADVPVLRKAMLKPTALLSSAVQASTGSRRIDALLKRLRPDVVYVSTLTLPLWIARARARRIPVVCHVHESERRVSRLVREALAWPLLLADHVVVNSRFSRQSLVDVVPSLARRSSVVYNGVAAPEDPLPPRKDLDGLVRLVYVGRLSPRKGPDVAIEALALLRRAGVDAVLELVGGVFPGYEWYEERLRDQVDELGLTSAVQFSGFRPAVWDFLARADVAVVPSREEEPFGNTAVEAVLAARPVAVSAIGGLAEAIDGFASALPVDPDDALALAQALHRIVSNWPAFRRSSVALAPIAARRYAPTRYRREIAAAIEGVLPARAREAVVA